MAKYELKVDEDGLGVILEYDDDYPESGGVIYEIENVTFTPEQGRIVYELLVAGHPAEWDDLEPIFEAECQRQGVDPRGPLDMQLPE